ncbi:MAG: hypothetical protein PHC51_12945 [bacterium]|nr:hypothetical protein [bacterium]
MTNITVKLPPIPRCVLIDSRKSSRNNLLRDLKESSLFEEVTEAASLKNALDQIRFGQFDACIIGPTLSPERLLSFVQEAISLAEQKGCAVVAVVPADNNSSHILRAAGTHAVVASPYDKSRFSEGIVLGVISANPNSPWKTLVEKHFPDIQYLITKKTPSLLPEGEFDEMTALDQILTFFSDSNSFLPAGSKVSHQAVEEVKELAKKLISGMPESGQIRAFLNYLETSLLEWVIEASTASPELANGSLRQKLLLFGHKTKSDEPGLVG